MLFIIDTNKEAIAVQEARKRGIPIVAVLDSNSDPDGIDYPIPGNDDAIRAVSLYCELLSGAVLDGIRAEIAASGGDVGELGEPPADECPPPMAEREPRSRRPCNDFSSPTWILRWGGDLAGGAPLQWRVFSCGARTSSPHHESAFTCASDRTWKSALHDTQRRS